MLLARLKRETLPLHTEIERSLDLLGIDLNLEDYTRVLRRCYGCYAQWEECARTVAPELLKGRGKSEWLTRDLLYFELRQGELLALERCSSLPPMHGTADVPGSMYVLEGATLGGQILRRNMCADMTTFASMQAWLNGAAGA